MFVELFTIPEDVLINCKPLPWSARVARVASGPPVRQQQAVLGVFAPTGTHQEAHTAPPTLAVIWSIPNLAQKVKLVKVLVA